MESLEVLCAGTLQHGKVEVSHLGQLSGYQFPGAHTKRLQKCIFILAEPVFNKQFDYMIVKIQLISGHRV